MIHEKCLKYNNKKNFLLQISVLDNKLTKYHYHYSGELTLTKLGLL